MAENFCSRASPTCSRERWKWRAAIGPAARVGRGGGCAPALPYIGGWAASLAPPPSPRDGGQRGGVGGKFPPFPLEHSLRVSPWAGRLGLSVTSQDFIKIWKKNCFVLLIKKWQGIKTFEFN
jgi:hypothetical protein